MLQNRGIHTVEPSRNSFETVIVDVTHRCNMACANCYLPNRDIPDMDMARLEDCLAAFPGRANIRIAGGEPTLRKDLPEIVATVRRCGHRAVLLTNGLRLDSEAYVSELRKAGLRHVYISLNGADNDDWYARIDNLRCARRKVRAVENVVAANMILNTGTILVRNLNEGAVKRVYDIVRNLEPRHAVLRFKNIGALGRYDRQAEARNLTMADLERLSARAIGCPAGRLSGFNRFKGAVDANTRLFPADPGARPGSAIWFKLTDWQADGRGFVDPDSKRRGRVTQDFRIAPFFDHVKLNEGAY